MPLADLQQERETLLPLLEHAVMLGDREEAELLAKRLKDLDKRIRKVEEGYRPKVYFAGSIRGGRVDAALYQRMIAHLKETCDVLTEHVGDPSLSALEQGLDYDAAIYKQDTAWLRESDLLIAECTCPSLGVGYELAYAEALKKPVHVFYDRSKAQLSAMIGGDSYFHVHPYESETELFSALDEVLDQL